MRYGKTWSDWELEELRYLWRQGWAVARLALWYGCSERTIERRIASMRGESARMHKKTYPVRVEDGHVYATVTLRDVIERTDVNGLPFLEEYKRLYEENDRLRELLKEHGIEGA